jgi:hypothetical protein
VKTCFARGVPALVLAALIGAVGAAQSIPRKRRSTSMQRERPRAAITWGYFSEFCITQ